MKRLLSLFMGLTLISTTALAGEYAGLTPGVSTKADADKALDAPIRIADNGRRIAYSPEGHDLAGLSVVVNDKNIIEEIHLFFTGSYEKGQAQEWFGLEVSPDETGEEEGHRFELYRDKGIKLVFEGLDENDGVVQLSHVNVNEIEKTMPQAAVDGVRCPGDAEMFAEEADPFIDKDQYAQAIAPLKKAVMCAPSRAIYASTLAYAYLQANRLNEAIMTAKDLVAKTEDYIAYSVLGNAYWQKNDCRAAIPYLEKAVTFQQDQPLQDNREFLGACYYKEGRLNEALNTLVKSYKRNKKSPLSVYFLAATSDRLGNKADAKFYYKKYLNLRHDDKDMNFMAQERLSVLNKGQNQSTREKTGQATREIIKTIFGDQ